MFCLCSFIQTINQLIRSNHDYLHPKMNCDFIANLWTLLIDYSIKCITKYSKLDMVWLHSTNNSGQYVRDKPYVRDSTNTSLSRPLKKAQRMLAPFLVCLRPCPQHSLRYISWSFWRHRCFVQNLCRSSRYSSEPFHGARDVWDFYLH